LIFLQNKLSKLSVLRLGNCFIFFFLDNDHSKNLNLNVLCVSIMFIVYTFNNNFGICKLNFGNSCQLAGTLIEYLLNLATQVGLSKIYDIKNIPKHNNKKNLSRLKKCMEPNYNRKLRKIHYICTYHTIYYHTYLVWY